MLIDENLIDYLNMSIIDHYMRTKSNPAEIQQCMDSIGFKVGYNLVERMIPDQTRYTDDVGVMKYICKEYWITLFSKQVDNLRTNNSGIFVLQDNSFRLLSHLTNDDDSIQMRSYYLSFACGLLRGTLSNLGYNNIVTSDTQSFPICKFQINLNANQSNFGLVMPTTNLQSSNGQQQLIKK